MAIIQSGSTTDKVFVDTQKAILVTQKPIDPTTLGHYRYASKTGTLAATLAANAQVFAFRWGDATRLAVITFLKVRMQGNVAFTAAAANMSLGAYIGRSFSGSSTGGTAVTATGNNLKMRTSFATSLINTNGDIRISTTAALGVGTVTVDTQPFAYGGPGRVNITNVAAGTEYLLSTPPGSIDFIADPARGEYPIVLAQNEGILVRNEVVWPAAGTGEVSVEIAWAEVASY